MPEEMRGENMDRGRGEWTISTHPWHPRLRVEIIYMYTANVQYIETVHCDSQVEVSAVGDDCVMVVEEGLASAHGVEDCTCTDTEIIHVYV